MRVDENRRGPWLLVPAPYSRGAEPGTSSKNRRNQFRNHHLCPAGPAITQGPGALHEGHRWRSPGSPHLKPCGPREGASHVHVEDHSYEHAHEEEDRHEAEAAAGADRHAALAARVDASAVPRGGAARAGERQALRRRATGGLGAADRDGRRAAHRNRGVGLVAAPGGSLTVAEDDPTHMGWLRDGEAVADLFEVTEE